MGRAIGAESDKFSADKTSETSSFCPPLKRPRMLPHLPSPLLPAPFLFIFTLLFFICFYPIHRIQPIQSISPKFFSQESPEAHTLRHPRAGLARQLPRSQRRPAPDHRSCLKSPIIRHWNRINKRLNSPPWNNKYKHHQHNFSIIPLIISNNGKLNIFFLVGKASFSQVFQDEESGGDGKEGGRLKGGGDE